MEIGAYILAILIGVTLGLIGSGGSILTVPILVYLLKIEPELATGYSLFIVGISALVGWLFKGRKGLVDYKMVFIFGIPSIFMILFTRSFIMPVIPEVIFSVGDFELSKGMFLMLLFAVIMFYASISMIKPVKGKISDEEAPAKYSFGNIFVKGLFLGLVTGMVGAGGGFLIVPTLVLFAGMPMHKAVATSLALVSFNALIGFLGYINVDANPVDWMLLMYFSLAAIVGIFIGDYLAKYISGIRLKRGFGFFVLSMAIFILLIEVLTV